MKRLRCAIYTRKSSEEGLEQGFNSLHAQREACAAYVLSQAGEGWETIATPYDDGGFSGGSMARPALQTLLTEIRRGQIDVVVVYKVDRLTRSLADFAKIVELFDANGVSFVSVTQAFNTTTSMGRLTLNVLLSFAQFEREIAGERIRDKIAASKAKGLWMGGASPLGYDGVDRKLVVNPVEAEAVRHVFARYLELGSVTKLVPDLAERGIRAKRRTNRHGHETGGGPMCRGALYYLLSNPVYRGAIRHKTRIYPGAHPEIIDAAIWDRVQAQLRINGGESSDVARNSAGVLLAGVVFDDRGNRMQALHTKRGAKRYRYYALPVGPSGKLRGSLPRIAMGVLDDFVTDQVIPVLAQAWAPDRTPHDRIKDAVSRVVLGEDRIVITIRPEAAVADSSPNAHNLSRTDGGLDLAISIRLKHRHGALIVTATGGEQPKGGLDRALIRAVCLARSYADQIARGEIATTKHAAKAHGFCDHYLASLMPLAWLAPDLVEMIIEGRQPRSLTLSAIIKRQLPMDWDEQRTLFQSLA